MGEKNTTTTEIAEALASFEPEVEAQDESTTEVEVESGETKVEAKTDDTPKEPTIEDTIAAQNAKILELEQRLAAPKEEKKEEQPLTPWTDQNFLPDDFDPDRLDKDSFNKILNVVASNAYKAAQEGAVSRVLTTIPNIVRHNVVLQSKLNDAVKEFYAENKELLPHSKQVAFIAEKLLAEKPELGVDAATLFEAAGKEAYARLGIKKGQRSTSSSRSGLTMVTGQHKQSGAPLEGVAAEIDEMLKAAE